MDQNNQNQQNQQPEQPMQPQQPAQNEPVSTVQQPADAQPTILPTESPAQPMESTTQAPQAAAPEAPAADANMPQAHIAPGGNDSSKKPMMIMLGIFMVVLVVAGGLYVMGAANRTQRLGMETQKTKPVTAQPTTAPTLIPEEQALEEIDLGNIEKDLQSLDTEVNTLQ